MKRWTLRILLCLILGAVTTVAVAWAATIVLPLGVRGTMAHETQRRIGTENWTVLANTRGARRFVHSWRWRQGIGDFETDVPPEHFAAPWTGFDKPTAAYLADPAATEARYLEAAGWPLLSLYCTYEQGDPPGAMLYRKAGLPLSQARWQFWAGNSVPRTLPIVPIFPGFLIDTFFYGALWFAILFGFAGARRAIRRRRGRCVNCGYDLRGAPASSTGRCPECGCTHDVRKSAPGS